MSMFAAVHSTSRDAIYGQSHLILDQDSYEIRPQLKYKQLWRGGQVVSVARTVVI
jgi:hypothetical protein